MFPFHGYNNQFYGREWWLWEETLVPKVMGSNPGTVYWMDILSHIFVVKIVMMFV